jgi:hypothetical protein
MLPWDPRADPLAARTAKVIAEQAVEERVRALEAKGHAIDIKADKNAGDDAEISETLELVDPAPSPEDFNRGRSR